MRYTVPVKVAAEAIGIGQTKLYELINDGSLQVVKLGRRTLVKVDSIERMLGVQAIAA